MVTPQPRENAGARVLLADDSPIHRKVIAHAIARLGVDVALASDGLEAVEQCRMIEFQLVLLDLQMPGLDGFDSAREIRKLPAPHGAAPILAISGDDSHDVRLRCRDAGMNGYVVKPVKSEELGAAVRRWISRAAAPEVRCATHDFDPAVTEQIVALCASRPGGSGASSAARIIDLYLRDAPERLARLSHAQRAGNARLVSEIAHSLKSSSASMGAVRLAALCRELETAGRAGENEALAKLITEATAAWNDARAALETIRARIPATRPE